MSEVRPLGVPIEEEAVASTLEIPDHCHGRMPADGVSGTSISSAANRSS
jgi:hypothetical protein